MRKKIFYLNYYDDFKGDNRECVLAAKNLIDYITDELINIGYSVRIISASDTKNTTHGCKARISQQKENLEIKFFHSLPKKNLIFRIIRYLSLRWNLFFELLKLKRSDTLIVYHSTSLSRLVKITHNFKKYNLVLYVGEIYSDVSHDLKLRKREFEIFKNADSFLLATDYLNKVLNLEKKPSIDIYGVYKNEEIRYDKFSDGKIHCIYAGTFDSRKGEAELSIKTSMFLSENYCIHICGFGTENDVEKTKKLIKEYNSLNKCKIIYDGCLSGENYIKLIQRCHIGLFTPNVEAVFNETDFPSKILSYLTNDLNVVSADVGPVKNSKIKDNLFFYEGNDPQNIATAIENINVDNQGHAIECIQRLQDEFKKDLKELLDRRRIIKC